MTTKEKIVKILKTKKETFNIEQFVLFGSFAQEKNNKKSDIDIAYILKDGYKLSFENYIKLEEDLASTLESKIDLMNYKKLNSLIKFNAQKDFIYV